MQTSGGKERTTMLWMIQVLSILMLSQMLSAQEASAVRNAAPVAAPAPGDAHSDYRIGPGDLLDVKVFGIQDFNQTSRVTSSGSISMPLLGSIDVMGKSAAQVETDISAKLVDQRLVRNPQVTVFVKEYRSQPVYVLGAVSKPGQYVMSGELRVIDAITLAGGLDPARAGETILVKRRRNSDSSAGASGDASADTATVESINLKALLEKGDASLNMPLRAGDIVQVSERKAEVFYVVGDVGKAGAFDFPRESKGGLRVSEAVIYAGGPAKTAKAKNALLVRYGSEGTREQFPVDFKAIIEGKKPDFPVKPNDIIYIPGSVTKTFGYAFAQAVPWAVANGLVFAIP